MLIRLIWFRWVASPTFFLNPLKRIKMANILITSSHGVFTIDRDTLEIKTLECYKESTRDTENNLDNITKFDFEEWKEHYKKEIPYSLDILDIGYYYKGFADHKEADFYEEPCHDWRLEMEHFNSQSHE